eukprot:4788170-Lingulodinium_polyedra.AAC.1
MSLWASSGAEGAGELDARVRSISRDVAGQRWRYFRSTVGLLLESDWDAWPAQGPRAFLGCC